MSCPVTKPSLSYFDTLAPGQPVDLSALFAHHRARYGASTMEDDDKPASGGGGDGGGGKDEDKPGDGSEHDKPDDPKDLGDAGKKALRDERAARKAAEKTNREQATRIADLEKANQTDAEKALSEAKEEGRAEAMKSVAPALVRAEFRAASAGRLDADRLKDLLEDLDLGRFLDDDGDVDAKKVAKKVDAWAPADSGKPGTPKPDRRQGAGDGTGGTKPGDAGRAEAQRRFGKKQ